MTVIASFIILHENITVMSAAGTLLTLAGLVISEFHTIAELFENKKVKKSNKMNA